MNEGSLKWLQKNAWNLIGLILGIGGLVSGYWFYRASIQFSSLSFVDYTPHSMVINYSAMSDSPVKLIRRDDSPNTSIPSTLTKN